MDFARGEAAGSAQARRAFFGCGEPAVDQLTSTRAEMIIERLMGGRRRGWPPVLRIRTGQLLDSEPTTSARQ
jgi:hypothetical protein